MRYPVSRAAALSRLSLLLAVFMTVSASGLHAQQLPVEYMGRLASQIGAGNHTVTGAAIGFVVGAGATYLLLNSGGSTSLCDRDRNQDAIGRTECLGLTAAGGVVGAGIGALIGRRIRRGPTAQRYEGGAWRASHSPLQLRQVATPDPVAGLSGIAQPDPLSGAAPAQRSAGEPALPLPSRIVAGGTDAPM